MSELISEATAKFLSILLFVSGLILVISGIVFSFFVTEEVELIQIAEIHYGIIAGIIFVVLSLKLNPIKKSKKKKDYDETLEHF